LVGLATLVLYPELGPADKKLGYVYAMRDFLPAGLKGMLVASFFAAYMSTIATQLNWGTSYVINDFYKRFIRPESEEKNLVLVSRVTTIVVMGCSIIITLILDTISGAWAFIIEAGAGLGLVLILRWFWWRVNAWSEIAAMVTPLLVYAIIKSQAIEFPVSLFYIVGVTTVVWIVVTFLTKPTSEVTLKNFYKRVHPGGIGWRPMAKLLPEIQGDSGYLRLFVDWVAGIVLVYAMLFGIGKFILGDVGFGVMFIVGGFAAAGVLYWDLSKRGFKKLVD